jgi:dihydrofolate reductase
MGTVYYTAVSLDGFIAAPDHDLAWLLALDSDPAGPLGFEGFLPRVGAVVMGANTYQWVLAHDTGPWPYQVPTWVLTHRTFPARPDADVRCTAAPVRAVHAEAASAAGERDVWLVGGGELVGQFHDAGLLDEVILSVAPVTLGAGAPLLPRRIDLELLEVARNRDFACTRHRVRR